MTRKQTRPISLAVAEEIAQKLFFLAGEEERSLSSYVRLLLMDHLKKVEEERGEIVVEPEIEEKEELLTVNG